MKADLEDRQSICALLFQFRLLVTARLFALLACLSAIASVADAAGEEPERWKLERGVELPSYAVIEPVKELREGIRTLAEALMETEV
jgi:hypothetical protein